MEADAPSSNEARKMEEKEEQKGKWNLVSYTARSLMEDEKAKLDSDNMVISEFKQMKLEKEAQKNWDLFYKRNTTKFFKDRHWTRREFEELCNVGDNRESKVVFEVGCGVGNFIFPLLEDDKTSFFYACDFSPRAVDFVKNHTAYDVERCKAFQCDITCDAITDNVPGESVDVATLIFVLSAINPEKMVTAVRNIAQSLKPGGTLLFRDYGLYDHAMLRFAKGHKISECFYVRQDGTRAFYFSIEKINGIMKEAGLCVGPCTYIHRSTINKKEGIDVERIFVQGKFTKPTQDTGGQDINGRVGGILPPEDFSSDQRQTETDTCNQPVAVSNHTECGQPDSHIDVAVANSDDSHSPKIS